MPVATGTKAPPEIWHPVGDELRLHRVGAFGHLTVASGGDRPPSPSRQPDAPGVVCVIVAEAQPGVILREVVRGQADGEAAAVRPLLLVLHFGHRPPAAAPEDAQRPLRIAGAGVGLDDRVWCS